jgi:hypothetical protein
MAKQEQLVVRVDSEMAELVRAAAKAQDRSVGQIIRQALAEYLDTHDVPPPSAVERVSGDVPVHTPFHSTVPPRIPPQIVGQRPGKK